jgi:hypothetical protein
MMPSVNRSAWTQHRGTNIIGAGFLDEQLGSCTYQRQRLRMVKAGKR